MDLCWALLPVLAGDALREGFANPPQEAKPHVWWHWMNGNVSKAALGRFFTEGYVDRALAALGPVSPKGGVHSLIVAGSRCAPETFLG